tara:strand:+ start:1642 stop:1839 length:198 start_codon:yes stop_codon:yes gene_type:complete
MKRADWLNILRIRDKMKDKEEAKQAAALEVTPVRPVVNNSPNYDEMWGVSGYYNDNDGNDIRDRD